jgi:hypothetical protein
LIDPQDVEAVIRKMAEARTHQIAVLRRWKAFWTMVKCGSLAKPRACWRCGISVSLAQLLVR